jgi:hypothetical protein
MLIIDSDTWHQAGSDDRGWLDLCQSHKGWLAAEFLRTVNPIKPVSTFFGSWFEICSESEEGFFFRYEAIKGLEKRFDMKEIALLEYDDHS